MELSSEFLRTKITEIFGFDCFKTRSSLHFQVLVDGVDRTFLLKNIEKLFSRYGAYYDPCKGSSSVGAVCIGKYTVGAAPLNKQGSKSAGIENEMYFIKSINDYCSNKPIDISIDNGIKSYHIKNVIGVQEVGRNTSDRKKSDVNFITADGFVVPISIKKDNAEMWESADKLWGTKAKKLLYEQLELGTVQLDTVPEKPGIFKLNKPILKKATIDEIEQVVFGSDILKNTGAVIFRTFVHSDFTFAKNILTINVSEIYQSPKEIEESKYPVYFLIRNDSSRKTSKVTPGLRVVAISKKKPMSNAIILE